MNICINCEQTTKNPRFCSRSCSASYNNKIPKRNKTKSYCVICQEECGPRRTKCDNCYLPDKTISEVIYTKHHKSSAYALIRTRARSKVRHKEQKCEICSYDKHVEVCHIKPISDFPKDTLISIVNSQDNLKLLCRNCHWEVDHGLINF